MEKMLRTFVEKNLYRDGFRDYLINSFSPVLKEYYLKYDISTYNKLLKKEEQQQLLHKFMEKECSDLFEFCSKNNVNIVGLKGIFIEKQFWSQSRFYNDIDVIIKKDDIKKLYDYFSKKGTYRVINKRDINPFKKKPKLSSMINVNLDKTHHIVLWNENNEIVASGLNYLEIEIHGSFDTFKIVDINDEIMFNDSILYNGFRVLDCESQILFLIYHTIQHLPYIRYNLSRMSIEIDKFIDVALILLNSKIDWNKFEKMCIIHSMSPLCAFYFKMFDEIFPNIVPEFIIERIREKSINMDFYWKNIYFRLMKMNPLDLILGNFNDFPEIEIPYLKIKNNILQGRYHNKYILKFSMELWKYKLNKVNLKLDSK